MYQYSNGSVAASTYGNSVCSGAALVASATQVSTCISNGYGSNYSSIVGAYSASGGISLVVSNDFLGSINGASSKSVSWVMMGSLVLLQLLL